MLHNAGYEVIGITLQLYDHGMAVGKKGSCCAGQDIYDAKMVADKMGFAHYVFDYESKFRAEVIDDFADSYLRGETPLPCVRCNQSVKFGDLLSVAKQLDADFMATGHYVQKIIKNGRAELHRGINLDKDQSYFLFATTNQQLEYLMFPLGGYTKQQTRELAKEFGLEIADKPDSQDICFVPDGNYRNVINKIRPGASITGKFMHIDGYELGEHQGIINYTIGQRRGLGISCGTPLYVIKIDPMKNIVYLGNSEHLVSGKFLVTKVNWLACDIELDQADVTVKIRSTMPGVQAKLHHLQNGLVEVELLQQEKAISPGQACVFYDGNRVLGGGWITN
jgi:tRNA-specific 2-thiouridylase